MYLLDSLTTMINKSSRDEPRYWFACYVLEHTADVADMNIEVLAKNCNTSAASVSRLVTELGCENYRAFREHCRLFANSYANLREQSVDAGAMRPDNVRNFMERELLPSLTAIPMEAVCQVADFLEGDVYLVGMATMRAITTKLQAYIWMNEERKIFLPNQTGELRTLQEKDHVIVFSGTGRLFIETDLVENLKATRARKMLLTTTKNDNAASMQLFDEIVRIPAETGSTWLIHHLYSFFIDMVTDEMYRRG